VPELELRVGERHELQLRGLGSAGYSWQASLSGPEGVLEVQRASSGPVASREPGGRPPDNESLPEAFQLVAVGEGRVRVRFALRRSWEDETPPIEESKLDVVVTASAPSGNAGPSLARDHAAP
jgi:predicted secreted protein